MRENEHSRTHFVTNHTHHAHAVAIIEQDWVKSGGAKRDGADEEGEKSA